MRLRIVVVAVAVLLISSAGFAQAPGQSISQVIVLGDSLSDNGNLFAATGNPPLPYWNGRASDGPVTVEYLAKALGVPLTDFAWYGATTGIGNYADGGSVASFGIGNLPGMTTVFQYALSNGLFPIDRNALYVVWGGPNDFWDVTNQPQAEAAIGTAVTNLVTIVGQLQLLGAKQIVVLNMPDLGNTPYLLASGPQASFFASQLSMGFNQALQSYLPPGVRYFDTFSTLSTIIANPGAYGLTNVTDPCFPGTSLCADPNGYLFFDWVHPTTAAHALVADALYRSVTVVIGDCRTGVPNQILANGFTISDLIAEAAASARNHGQFVSAVASLTNGLVKSGVVSGSQKGAIQGCAAK